MRDAAIEAIQFAAGETRSNLGANRLLELALTQCVQIIGEAASQVDRATRDSVSSLPWSQTIGMRNRLVHAYAHVDLDYLWDTIQLDLPLLVEEVTRILETDPSSDEE